MRKVKAGSERLYILIIELFSQRGQVCHHSQQSESLRHQPFTEGSLSPSQRALWWQDTSSILEESFAPPNLHER